MTASCYLRIMRSFWKRIFYRAPLRNCLFHVQVAEFQPPDTVNASQAFYARTWSSHSKAFIYSKSLNIICDKVNLQWSCGMPTYKFTKKTLSHILLHVFCLHFLRTHHNYFPKRLWKCASTISFREYKWKVVLLVIYLFNDDLSKSTFLMLNMAFNVLFRTVFVK